MYKAGSNPSYRLYNQARAKAKAFDGSIAVITALGWRTECRRGRLDSATVKVTKLENGCFPRSPTNPIILIPARLAATRLPGKPLLDIAGQPMIVHVWRRAMEPNRTSRRGHARQEIIDAIEAAAAVLKEPDIIMSPVGPHRRSAARTGPERRHDAVINVQGDLPVLDRRPFGPLPPSCRSVG